LLCQLVATERVPTVSKLSASWVVSAQEVESLTCLPVHEYDRLEPVLCD